MGNKWIDSSFTLLAHPRENLRQFLLNDDKLLAIEYQGELEHDIVIFDVSTNTAIYRNQADQFCRFPMAWKRDLLYCEHNDHTDPRKDGILHCYKPETNEGHFIYVKVADFDSIWIGLTHIIGIVECQKLPNNSMTSFALKCYNF